MKNTNTNTNTKMRKLGLFVQAIKRKVKAKFEDFTREEPILKAEAVERTLRLLRKDFDMADQNDIVLSLIQRLHDIREKDIVAKEQELENMRKESDKLKEKVVLT
jgi:hypothetical protein